MTNWSEAAAAGGRPLRTSPRRRAATVAGKGHPRAVEAALYSCTGGANHGAHQLPFAGCWTLAPAPVCAHIMSDANIATYDPEHDPRSSTGVHFECEQVICGHLARVVTEGPALASSRASSHPLLDERDSAAVGALPGASQLRNSRSIPAAQPGGGTAAQTRLREAAMLVCQLLFLPGSRALHRPLVSGFRKLSHAGQQIVAEVLCEQVRTASRRAKVISSTWLLARLRPSLTPRRCSGV